MLKTKGHERVQKPNKNLPTPNAKIEQAPLPDLFKETYWFTRIVFLRGLSFLYGVAFLIALNQNDALLSSNGLLPIKNYLHRINDTTQGDLWDRFQMAPTLLWFIQPPLMDLSLRLIATLGLTLSILVFVLGSSNMIIMTSLWVLYHSIVNVGQRWYSFGWESQLLETGFLSIFLVPFFSLKYFPDLPSPWVVRWGYLWLLWRIMVGAGLIKLRGDACWRELTCMKYHYETQPVPNPLSWYLHNNPEWFHNFETLVNHFVEIVVPFFLFLPRESRIIGGVIQILFQLILIISGNLSFLNWLTILPSIWTLDDKFLSFLFSSSSHSRLSALIHRHHPPTTPNSPSPPSPPSTIITSPFSSITTLLTTIITTILIILTTTLTTTITTILVITLITLVITLTTTRSTLTSLITSLTTTLSTLTTTLITTLTTTLTSPRTLLHLAVALLILRGSVPVVQNLISPRQMMNSSFDFLRIVNTYGAFGSVTKVRHEVILQGSPNETLGKENMVWYEYEFKCKPGNPSRRPCFISPYHYRLDWLMWFAAFQNYQQNPWLLHLIAKLLVNDPLVTSLLAHNPFVGQKPPKYVRAELYQYWMPAWGSEEAARGQWWERKHVGEYVPVVDVGMLRPVLESQGW